MLWTILKWTAGTIALLLAWAWSTEQERREQLDEETDGRIRAALDELAMARYGKPFDELDSTQQQEIVEELKWRW